MIRTNKHSLGLGMYQSRLHTSGGVNCVFHRDWKSEFSGSISQLSLPSVALESLWIQFHAVRFSRSVVVLDIPTV
jgi:hypothetical protein